MIKKKLTKKKREFLASGESVETYTSKSNIHVKNLFLRSLEAIIKEDKGNKRKQWSENVLLPWRDIYFFFFHCTSTSQEGDQTVLP